jgi:hypothetical protein
MQHIDIENITSVPMQQFIDKDEVLVVHEHLLDYIPGNKAKSGSLSWSSKQS